MEVRFTARELVKFVQTHFDPLHRSKPSVYFYRDNERVPVDNLDFVFDFGAADTIYRYDHRG